MKRIIIHWTAGTYFPNGTDLEHYHFLIDKNGKIYCGKYKPEDNENCSDGKYAAHTGGGNTGAVGIALCGMYGFKNRDNAGRYPITPVQCEVLFSLTADLCREYNIGISENTVMTHYEFGKKYPETSSRGKIDIVFLPPYPNLGQTEIGGFIRSQVIKIYKR